MPHPKKKSTKTSRKTRASHFALKKADLLACPKCKEPKKPHSACPACGSYKRK